MSSRCPQSNCLACRPAGLSILRPVSATAWVVFSNATARASAVATERLRLLVPRRPVGISDWSTKWPGQSYRTRRREPYDAYRSRRPHRRGRPRLRRKLRYPLRATQVDVTAAAPRGLAAGCKSSAPRSASLLNKSCAFRPWRHPAPRPEQPRLQEWKEVEERRGRWPHLSPVGGNVRSSYRHSTVRDGTSRCELALMRICSVPP